MKNFTQSLFLACVMAIGLNVHAQYDVEALAVLPSLATANQEIPPNYPVSFTLFFENTGSTTIPANATGRVVYLINGDTLQSNSIIFESAFPVGGISSLISQDTTFTSAPSDEIICGYVILDPAWAETDSTNNLACDTFEVSNAATVDLSAHSLVVNTPNNLEGFDIDNGNDKPDSITSLSWAFSNEGTVILPIGYTFAYAFSFGDQTVASAGAVATAFASGDTAESVMFNPNFGIPAQEGDFEVCVTLLLIDENVNNNTNCWEWTMVDNSIPPPPPGIDENANSNLNIFASHGNIQVLGIIEPIEITLMDITGKMIETHTLIRDGALPTASLAKGVYIIQAHNTTNGGLSAHKISVQ